MTCVCVIKPSLAGRRANDALPPLLFAILRGLTPPDVRLIFIDENVEPVRFVPCDAVAISIDTFTAGRGYALAARFRERSVPVILGGMHATFCPDEAAGHADSVVVGEAEDTWGDVVADLKAGSLKPRYAGAGNADLASLRCDYSVYHGKHYPPVGIVQFGRGCRFNCEFCSIHAFYGTAIRTRPVVAVVDDFRQMPGKIIFFADDNLLADPVRLDELLVALTPLKRRWVCQISVDAGKNRDLLRRLRLAGCVMVIMGLETLNRDNLRAMNKGVNRSVDYETVLRNLRRSGIMLYGTFVIGYDGDGPGTAMELAGFARRHGFAIANFNPLIPTPGCALYDRLGAEGRLLYERWWDDPSYRYGDTAFRPIGMTPDQLRDGCRQARFSFYSLPGIFARFRGANRSGLFQAATYWLINLISRASIHAKQGRSLR